MFYPQRQNLQKKDNRNLKLIYVQFRVSLIKSKVHCYVEIKYPQVSTGLVVQKFFPVTVEIHKYVSA